MGKRRGNGRRNIRATLPAYDQGTLETRSKLKPCHIDTLAKRLRTAGHPFAAEIEAAAREIEAVYHARTAGLFVRAVDMNGTRGRSNGDGPKWLVHAYAERYKPWADEMSPTGALKIVIDWVWERKTMPEIDAARRQRNGTAATVVEHALTRYATIAGWIRPVEARAS